VNTTGGGWIALIVGVLGALWSASGYVGGFSRALNKIYEIGEGRPVWKLRPQLLLVTAIEVVLIIIVMVALVASGSVAREIGKQIGLGHQAVQIWGIAKWPVVVFIVVFIIGMLYWATPNVRKMKRDIFSWGALFAFVIWVLGSIALVLYVGFTQGSSYQKTYGAFAGAIIFMLWLWITNLAMLFGAELDAELIRTRQLRTGLEAEHIVLLPPRDESGLQKKEDKQKKLLKEATALRTGETVATGAAGGGALGILAKRDTDDGGNRKDGQAMSTKEYDAQEARAQVAQERRVRREKALTDAKAARKVRDRLERQEAKAKKKFDDALKQVKKERKAREGAQTYEQRRAKIEETRAKYAPRQTPARTEMEAEHRARRASYDAEQAEKRAKAAAAPPEPPKPPKKPKEKKPPMPSELRTQVEKEQTERRLEWYAEHRPGR